MARHAQRNDAHIVVGDAASMRSITKYGALYALNKAVEVQSVAVMQGRNLSGFVDSIPTLESFDGLAWLTPDQTVPIDSNQTICVDLDSYMMIGEYRVEQDGFLVVPMELPEIAPG